MDLGAVYEEIETKLRTLASPLRVVKPGEMPSVPAAMVLLPDSIERQTYRGLEKVTDVVVLVLVDRVTARSTQKRALAYASSDGPSSIKKLIDPTSWVACTDVTVTSVTFDIATIAGAQEAYLALQFHCDIIGTGA